MSNCGKKAVSAKSDLRPSTEQVNERPGSPESVYQSIILGKVVSKEIPEGGLEPKHPCDVYACVASVEIISVVQQGQLYIDELQQGSQIRVYFAFTTEPTEKIFPELNEPLPGLKTGDYFQASITASPDMENTFKVNLYERKN